jgi:hypothetical protein
MNWTRVTAAALSLSLAATSIAQAGPYDSYMSALVDGCPTFGPSSQDSLSMVGRTRQLLEELSRDSSCQGISTTVNALNVLQSQLVLQSNPDSKAQAVLEAQRRVDELTLLVSSPPTYTVSNDYNIKVSQALADARVQLAVATANTGNESSYSEAVRKYGTLPEVQRALTNILAGLPALERCASRKPELFAEVVGTLLPAVAGVANPAFGVAASAGGALIKQIAEYMSQSKYSSSMRKLEEMKQQAALGCALEHIQFSRCSAEDGISLIEWQSKGLTSPPSSSANWRGYNLLTVYLPTLTDWVQALQSGQSPQRTEDANFNSDTDKILTFFNSTRDNVLALINEARLEVPADADQRNIGIEVLQKLYNLLTGAGASVPKVNVFMRIKTAADLPFFLVGKTPEDLAIPNISFGSSLAQVMDSRNRDKLPSNLVEVIREQFNIILKGGGPVAEGGAEKALSEVLSRRRNDDAENLMAQVIIPREAGRSPYDVLQGIQGWLQEYLRIPENVLAATFKTQLSDGRVQARRTLQLAKSTAEAIHEVIQAVNDTTASPSDQISLISMRLNILKSRDRFLVERLSNLVRVQLQAEVNSDRTDREIRAIFDSSKNDVYQKLTSYGARSRQDTYDDLRNATYYDSVHMDIIADFFDRDIRRFLKLPLPSHTRDLQCMRLLALPKISKDIRRLCEHSKIDSIYLSQPRLDPQWKDSLQLRFDDYAQLPYAHRACAYRNFRRTTYLFEDISGISRRQNLPGSR